jgi:hypothetical protein
MKRAASNSEQFITDSQGKKVGVILDLETYRRLLEAEEDLADIAAYDIAAPAAHVAMKKGDYITLDQLKTRRRK